MNFHPTASSTYPSALPTYILPVKGKKIDPKKITEKEKIRKIFVGGVSLDIPEEEVKTHFEQFGAIEEIVFPTNKETKQRKGFCFITFVDPECCDAACSKQNQKQQVGSKMVDVKKVRASARLYVRGFLPSDKTFSASLVF